MFSKLCLHMYGKLLTGGTWNLGGSQVGVANPGGKKFLNMVSMYQNLWP